MGLLFVFFLRFVLCAFPEQARLLFFLDDNDNNNNASITFSNGWNSAMIFGSFHDVRAATTAPPIIAPRGTAVFLELNNPSP